MKKTDLEYEYIIKGLIDANLRECFGKNIDPSCRHWMLKFMDKEFEISLHIKTSYQVILDYFYQQVMKWGPNKIKTAGYMGEDC
jgi:hypothetical protein